MPAPTIPDVDTNIALHATRPPLPAPFTYTQPPPTLYFQGAEALLYRTHFLFPLQTEQVPDAQASSRDTSTSEPGESHSSFVGRPLPAALKYRPSKPYRHPILDTKLTRHRILAEARVLAKLRREGLTVPALYALDWGGPSATKNSVDGRSDGLDTTEIVLGGGWMLMEWIEGETVRKVLDKELAAFLQRSSDLGEAGRDGEQPLSKLMRKIGTLVGKMHETGVVHGDLTTSNLILRPKDVDSIEVDELDGEVVLLDFGLASQSVQEEDRAVDLYVLERAFGSTHPKTEGLFGEVLRSYGSSYKGAKVALKRLEEVRMRGRKKIMIG